MELQRVDLINGIAVPDEPPYWDMVARILPPETWSDLTDRGYPGVGYWPIERISPTYNQVTQKLGNETTTLDFGRKVVIFSREVLNLEEEELQASFIAKQTQFIKQVDVDVDLIYALAIGNRGPEYDQAAADANEFKDNGYVPPVPTSVNSWAIAKDWTAQDSADDIIAAANRLGSARDAIRANRLLRKEQARNATTMSGLSLISQQWNGFVAVVRSQLGV